MVRGASEDRDISSHFRSPRARPFLFSPYLFATTLRSVQPNESCPHTPSTHRAIRCCDMTRKLIRSQEAQFRDNPPLCLWSFQLYPALVFLGVIPPRVPHRFHVLPRVSSAIPRDPNLHIPIVGRCPDVVCEVPSSPPGEPPPRPALRCPLNFRPFLLDVIQSRTELF